MSHLFERPDIHPQTYPKIFLHSENIYKKKVFVIIERTFLYGKKNPPGHVLDKGGMLKASLNRLIMIYLVCEFFQQQKKLMVSTFQ